MLNRQTLDHLRQQSRELREDLFIERYERLLGWALRLTDHDRAAAEDLVQDAFISFVQGRTNLEDIENLDGYLRRMLRYMHLTRINRHSAREQSHSVTENDTLAQTCASLEPSRRMQSLDELWRICNYACDRKQSSRAGAVLILRFFHEYSPPEIAKVICSSRHCVDQWLKLARRELELYLKGNGRRLRLLNAKSAKPSTVKLSALDGDLIGELRQMIFRSRQGDCLQAEELRGIYKSGNQETLTTSKLAHIVSCRSCLDTVNLLLDLPLLSERYEGTSSDSDEPPDSGASGAGSFDRRNRLTRAIHNNGLLKRLRLRAAGPSIIDAGSPELTFDKPSSWGPTTPFWTRPGWVTIFIAALAVCTYLLVRTGDKPPATATNLLEQARFAELNARTRDQVTHRVISLEERNLDGTLLSRNKIDIWENPASSERAQRLYNENNQLLAGTWQKADGSQVVYHHGSGLRPDRTPRADALLLNLEDIWRLGLSANDFTAVVANDAGRVLEQPLTYVITYANPRSIGATRLLKASLTLNRMDLRPTEQAITVQRGNETREYRFAEASFAQMPRQDVPAQVFEPALALEGRNAGIGTRGERGALAPVPITPTLRAASAELEVDVAYLLNQAKGDRHEQLSLLRTPNGLLQVEGVVETQQRKDELLHAFAVVSNNPAVRIDITVVTDVLKRQPNISPRQITSSEVEETADTIAVDRELRNYLSRNTSEAELDEAVRSFSSRTLNRAYRAVFHAIELKKLVSRFAQVDMRTVTPDARSKWLQMLRQQAAAFERETTALQREIQPVFSQPGSAGAVGENLLAGDADLARAVEQLHKLAVENNEAVRAAFAISPRSSDAAIKSSQFWRSLTHAMKLAAQIKRYHER